MKTTWLKKLIQPSKLTISQQKLAKILSVPKSREDLLIEALSHPSYSSENGTSSYQRLEFLGDAVVGLYAANRLYSNHPDWDEGKLTRARASVVSMKSLADMGRKLGISECVLLGRGERMAGGENRDTILADVFEAVVAVVTISCGMDKAFALMNKYGLLDEATDTEDPKSQLQALAHDKSQKSPIYTIISQEGPPHATKFLAQVEINGVALAKAWGTSKQDAERKAAREALEKF